jgi:hypothetical protein
MPMTRRRMQSEGFLNKTATYHGLEALSVAKTSLWPSFARRFVVGASRWTREMNRRRSMHECSACLVECKCKCTEFNFVWD